MTLTNHNNTGSSKRLPDKVVPINYGFIKVIKATLHSAVENLELANAAIILRSINVQQYRHLIISDELQHPESRLESVEEEFIISTEMSMTPLDERLNSSESICVMINLDNSRLGYLIARPKNISAHNSTLTAKLNQVAQQVVNVIKRYQTRRRIIDIYGNQPYWIGSSIALRQLDLLIEHLTQSNVPILIRGDKGTGKTLAARALHCHKHAEIRPFIESSCEEWERGSAAKLLPELWAHAKGGTLFLRNIDKLSRVDYQILQQFWHLRDLHSNQKSSADKSQLILSLSKRDYNFDANNAKAAEWLALYTQELCLPNLHERREDIGDLARFFMREYHLNIEFDLTEDALQLLEEYHWPGNVPQLKNIIRMLAVITEQRLINAEFMLTHFPELKEKSTSSTSEEKINSRMTVHLLAGKLLTPGLTSPVAIPQKKMDEKLSTTDDKKSFRSRLHPLQWILSPALQQYFQIAKLNTLQTKLWIK